MYVYLNRSEQKLGIKKESPMKRIMLTCFFKLNNVDNNNLN